MRLHPKAARRKNLEIGHKRKEDELSFHGGGAGGVFVYVYFKNRATYLEACALVKFDCRHADIPTKIL